MNTPIPKTLIGNSGEIVTVQGMNVTKERGTNSREKFMEQMMLLSKGHKYFIPITVKEYGESYIMPYISETFYDNLSIKEVDNLLDICDNYRTTEYDKGMTVEHYLDIINERVFMLEDTELVNSGFTITPFRSFVHGDLTVSNILYDDGPVFIDPKGTKEHFLYDAGKLLQSFEMDYEYLLSGSAKYPSEYKNAIYDRYDRDELRFFLAVHLLRAVPYFKKNNRSYTDLFYDTGLKIMSELGITLKTKKDTDA